MRFTHRMRDATRTNLLVEVWHDLCPDLELPRRRYDKSAEQHALDDLDAGSEAVAGDPAESHRQ